MSKFVVLFSLLVLSFFSLADTCPHDPTLSCGAASTTVTIGEPLLGSAPREVKNLLGIHALLWGVQTDLYGNTPSRVLPQAVSILRDSGVGFIRYGGGVNEIDWRGCTGWVLERPKQQLVDWAEPMRCVFGLAEYEKLNDELGLALSWHIANVVGFEGKLNPVQDLAKDAGDRAILVKQLSGNRQRFWELGNELDRDTLKWSAEKIASRDLPVAASILKNDPDARIVVPLLEYKPDWIQNDNEHNRFLVRQHKKIASDFSLHLYYDNVPWGPSVANRLASVRNVAKIINAEGVPNPAIWITEHARPPPGTPKDPNWKQGWHQTGSQDAVVATADFLIGLSQIPMVQGAVWHGLRAGPWNFIDVSAGGALRNTRMSRLFGLMTPPFESQILATKTTSINEQGLPGGYAVRAAAFADRNSSKYVVWLVNRSAHAQPVRLSRASFGGASSLQVRQTDFSGAYDPSASLDSLPVLKQTLTPFNGTITVTLPKRSFVLLSIQPDRQNVTP
ncbi:MAG: hypothetical protein Q8S73_15740 [Deltaproteobacteria bacterium]|nr:hypothetical protein [Gammaproteobacteria bacterium]MDP3215559.1 hypothetical protein [Deltaproteobacteria bacterium]